MSVNDTMQDNPCLEYLYINGVPLTENLRPFEVEYFINCYEETKMLSEVPQRFLGLSVLVEFVFDDQFINGIIITYDDINQVIEKLEENYMFVNYEILSDNRLYISSDIPDSRV